MIPFVRNEDTETEALNFAKTIRESGNVFAIALTSKGILKSFSGSLGGKYIVQGFVPPCFSVNDYERTGNKNYLFTDWNGERFSVDNIPCETADSATVKIINSALRNRIEIKSLAVFTVKRSGEAEFINPDKNNLITAMLGLDYVYSDGYIAVINKEEGMLSIPGRFETDSVQYRFNSVFPSSPKVSAAHRLDMGTSGLMILSYTKEAKREIGIAFENRLVEKRYEALLDGTIDSDCGVIDSPIAPDYENRPYRKIDPVRGKASVTEWKKTGTEIIDGRKYTRVIFCPKTGRTHQIRVHAASIGHPIKGDGLYGTAGDGERLALHACFLSFRHPKTGEILTFESPAPFRN